MKRSLAITAASVTMLASACITDQALWGSCNPAGDPWGTDGHWVLYCDKGEWVPTMTAQEFVDISSGKNVTIGTLPTKPVPTTTTTTSTTSTTSTIPVTPAVISGMGLGAGGANDNPAPKSGGTKFSVLGTGLTGATSVRLQHTVESDQSFTITLPKAGVDVTETHISDLEAPAVTVGGTYEVTVFKGAVASTVSDPENAGNFFHYEA